MKLAFAAQYYFREADLNEAAADAPAGLDISTLTQAESARPFTITTADGMQRIAIKGNPTTLEQFRGTPCIQADMRLARPIRAGER